ncbi:hypothetical protein ACIQXD_22420 [Streptomyces uncialis]|uniref:BACON domain-containing protein n=1 Tax=Streptomyces uncialis TaxID=1048205 RepID=UPI00380CAFE4
MTSSRTQRSSRATGAHRAHRAEPQRTTHPTVVQHPPAQHPPARYEPHLDGLFTYCLSVLCDHDAATAALGDVLALARRRANRAPAAESDHRPWLYALARWACLRRLAESKKKRQSSHARGRSRTPSAPGAPPGPDARGEGVPGTAERGEGDRGAEDDRAAGVRRRELAQLAWPEAAGTSPEQREALELAVRHRLAVHEVGAVLGLSLARARDLLASAACEVERTRTALAVVESGTCTGVARLMTGDEVLLGTTLRGELVRHVDDCPRCRRTAERAGPGAWPGTSISPSQLPLIVAPRAAVRTAMAHAPRARGTTAPRFDRQGFPLDPKDHAARRDRLRTRAVTTTVVATVVAAPVIALWAAYRGAPVIGGDARPVTASEAGDNAGSGDERAPDTYPNTGNAGNARSDDDPRHGPGGKGRMSAEVISPGGAADGGGRLGVAVFPRDGATFIALTAARGAPVHWTATPHAPWLHLSRTSGTLAPGDTFTLQVRVDTRTEPSGPWQARISLGPSGAVVLVQGYGDSAPEPPRTRPTTPVRPADPGTPDPGTPGGPGAPPGPGPGPTPTSPGTPPGPGPGDPGPGPSSTPGAPSEPGPGSPSGPPDPGPTDPGTPPPASPPPGDSPATG